MLLRILTRIYMLTSLLFRALCAIALASLAAWASAQTWPTKPVRIVLQFPPGGSTDLVARILAQAMSGTLGQPVIIDKRPGVAAHRTSSATPARQTPNSWR